ncbi:MAG: 4Fe-4S binding protein [Coriobacteriales bacterium]|jgi:NAD-dependent dihydropyrimidine dehydrogenase PreA subunit
MSRPDIDTDECTACGSCVDACPMGVIEIEDEVATVVDEDSCIACGSCVDACPSGAILEIVEDE